MSNALLPSICEDTLTGSTEALLEEECEQLHGNNLLEFLLYNFFCVPVELKIQLYKIIYR